MADTDADISVAISGDIGDEDEGNEYAASKVALTPRESLKAEEEATVLFDNITTLSIAPPVEVAKNISGAVSVLSIVFAMLSSPLKTVVPWVKAMRETKHAPRNGSISISRISVCYSFNHSILDAYIKR